MVRNAVYAEKIKQDLTLFVTHGESDTKLTSLNGKITACTVLKLCINQEEADTRILLYANHPYENSGRDAGEIRAIKSLADERY